MSNHKAVRRIDLDPCPQCPDPIGAAVDSPSRVGSPSQRARWPLPAQGDDGCSASPPPMNAAEVFRAYGPRVYSVALGMLANAADAEDIVQDVLLQVVRKLDSFRGDSSLATWLHRITVNAVLLHRRKKSSCKERHTQHSLDQMFGDRDAPARPGSRTPDEEVLVREERERIEKAIAQLPGIYQEVYVLADVEGLPNAEIGGRLGISLPAVKSRLLRGRLMLRSALAPYFEEVAA